MGITTKQIISRVFKDFIRPQRKKIFLAIFFMILYAACNAVQPLLLKYVFDDVLQGSDSFMKQVIPLAIIVVFSLTGIANYFSNYVMGAVGYTIVGNMQKSLFNHIIQADLALYYKTASGELVSRIINDINQIRAAVSMVIISLFKQILVFIGLVGVMFYTNWELSLIASSVLIFVVVPFDRVARRLKKLARQNQHNAANLTSMLGEIFMGIRVIKAYQQESHEVSSVNHVVDETVENRIKSGRVSNINAPIMGILAGIAIAAVLWYSAGQIERGEITTGDLVGFITALLMASRPLKTLGGINNVLSLAYVAAERFYEMMDTKPQVVDKAGAVAAEVSQADIKFENVSFSYDESRTALTNLNIHIPAGKKVALVGPSGGGKSTIMNLILRFFDPESGKITIDGKDISEVTMESLRKNISIVSQDVFLFDDTVRANIAYGKNSATDEEIISAAKTAVADEFIQLMPNGYNTIIGEGGIVLSGGQKQRLSIARAVLRNAPILLLDEATSALDNASEREFQKALDVLTKGRTTLIIAHRLSTILNADLIYVIDEGKVVDSGTHEELLARSELYRSLYH